MVYATYVIVICYGAFALTLSWLTFNAACLRVVEDTVLVGYAALQCAIIVFNNTHVSEG